MIGKTINNYVIERKLGGGGMGNVYFARHNRVDRMVAIKVLHQELFTNENIRNRFKNEANALIKLVHPNIVKIYDYVEQDNFACLVMEYIEGYTLDDYITKVSGPLVTEKAIPVICSILDAVQYAHDNNIFHRDIKPGNIMVSKDGAKVRIMDFGIAKIIDNENFKATKANTQLGTPFYMSPEHVKGLAYTAASDIYSLGVTLYEMVTGKCPYHDITNLFKLHSKIVNEPLPPTSIYYPDVATNLQAAIIKATQKDPSKRFRSCTAFKNFLLSETKPKTESPPRQAVKKNTKSQPAQPVKAVAENKSEPARQPVKQTMAEINKISAPNLLAAAYPEKERKSKAWIFLLAIGIIIIFAVFFHYEKTPINDRDKDGVQDSSDRCPDDSGLVSLKGCPDRDNDSIADIDDRCPDSSGLASLKGCPDRDKDSIANIDDKCPDLAGIASLTGCPDIIKPPPPPDKGLQLKDVLRDAIRQRIIFNVEVFTNDKKKGQSINAQLPDLEEIKEWIIGSEHRINVEIKFAVGPQTYQFLYKKTANGLKYIKCESC